MSRSAVWFGLNAIRFFSIVGIILVFASSIVVLVNDIHAIQRASAPQVVISNGTDSDVDALATDCGDYLDNSTVPNQPAGPFWAIVNRFLIIFEIIALFMSEMEFKWIQKFFATFFPVLGPDFGVGALGIFECLIGASILSHHVNEFALVSAFFLFAVGCLNILAGLIFREKSKTRRALKPQEPSLKDFVLPQHTSRSAASSNIFTNSEKNAGLQSPAPVANHPSAPYRPTNAAWGSKIGGLKSLAILNKQAEARQHQISNPIAIPEESLPRYAPGGSGSGRESPAYGSGGSAI